MYFEFLKRLANLVNKGSNLISKEDFESRAMVLFMFGKITEEEYTELLTLVTDTTI